LGGAKGWEESIISLRGQLYAAEEMEKKNELPTQGTTKVQTRRARAKKKKNADKKKAKSPTSSGAKEEGEEKRNPPLAFSSSAGEEGWGDDQPARNSFNWGNERWIFEAERVAGEN